MFVNDLITYIIRVGMILSKYFMNFSHQAKYTAIIHIIRAFFMPIVAYKILQSRKRNHFSYFSEITNLNIEGNNIETIFIPNHIKEIKKNAFNKCTKLKNVCFSISSNLEKIGEMAFANTSIDNIIIPIHVKKISAKVFANCKNLKTVDFDDNSELTTIDSYAFYLSTIERLTIPSNVIELNIGWCSNTPELKDIRVSAFNPNLIYYDDSYIINKKTKENLLFSRRNIKKVVIPPFIKRIAPFAFENCNCIQKVEISNDSKLYMIYQYAFDHSSINYISIPQNVTHIFRNAFSNCLYLKKVEFSNNCKISAFNAEVFSNTSIREILVPSSIQIIGERAFSYSKNLNKIVINENAELKIIDNFAFENTSLTSFSFPRGVIRIGSSIFKSCNKMQIIELHENFIQYLNNIKNELLTCQNVRLLYIPNGHQISNLISTSFI